MLPKLPPIPDSLNLSGSSLTVTTAGLDKTVWEGFARARLPSAKIKADIRQNGVASSQRLIPNNAKVAHLRLPRVAASSPSEISDAFCAAHYEREAQ